MRAIAACGALALSALVLHAAPARADVTYYGGPVVSHAVVQAIDWGPNVAPSVTSAMPTFLGQLANSTWWDILAQYSTTGRNGTDGDAGSNQTIARGSFGAQTAITPSNTSTTVSDTDVATELVAQITAARLPAIATDATGNVNTIYVVFFPASVTVTTGGSAQCSQFCAMHSTFTYGAKLVPFIIIPDVSAAACMGACVSCPGGTCESLPAATAALASNELAEAVTDPAVGVATTAGRPLAWYDTSAGEIGTLCGGATPDRVSVSGVSLPVRRIWSHAQQACEPGGVGVDGGMPDASVPDASVPDASVPDASVADAGDAGADGASSDARADGASDATTDATTDASDLVPEPAPGLWCAFAVPARRGAPVGGVLAVVGAAGALRRRRRPPTK